jgi:hypothetical protein
MKSDMYYFIAKSNQTNNEYTEYPSFCIENKGFDISDNLL